MIATFWVTTNCNLRCKYCYEGSEKLSKIMSYETIDKSINFVLNQNTKDELFVSIHGGEPFLEFEKIKYIVKKFKEECYTRDISVKFIVTTNLTIFNDEIEAFIIKEIPDITISIDGRKSTHDKYRLTKDGSGTHDIVMKNSKKLLESLPNLRIRMTYNTNSIKNLSDDVEYLIDQGFKVIVPIADLFERNWDNCHVDILENELKKLKAIVESKKNENLLIGILEKLSYLEKGYCGGGKNSFNIYPDGKLYPCVLSGGMEEFCIGNIFEGVDINKRDEILNYSNFTNKECDGCSLSRSCDGNRCKIMNKIIVGDYLSPPPMYCAIQNLKAEIL